MKQPWLKNQELIRNTLRWVASKMMDRDQCKEGSLTLLLAMWIELTNAVAINKVFWTLPKGKSYFDWEEVFSQVKQYNPPLPPPEIVESANAAVGSVESANTAVGNAESANAAVGNAESANAAVGSVESANAAVGNAESANTAAGNAESANTVVGNAESAKTTVGNAESANTVVGNAESAKTTVGNAESTNTAVGNAESANTAAGNAAASANTTAGNAESANTAAGNAELANPQVNAFTESRVATRSVTRGSGNINTRKRAASDDSVTKVIPQKQAKKKPGDSITRTCTFAGCADSDAGNETLKPNKTVDKRTTASNDINQGANQNELIKRNSKITKKISNRVSKLSDCVGEVGDRPGYRMEPQDQALLIRAMEGVINQLGDTRVYQE